MICQDCGVEAETKFVTFYQNIGAFVVRFPKSVQGDKWNDVCDTIRGLHDTVDWDAFWKAAIAFVGKHMDAIQRQM